MSAPWFFRLLKKPLAAVIALMAALLAGLSVQAQTTNPAAPLHLFAAASLQTALDQLAKDWQAAGRAPLSITYAGSPTLAQQIDKGAPADLFISADAEWMDWLNNRNSIKTASIRPLLSNRLVLVAPAGGSGGRPTPPETIKPDFDVSGTLKGLRLAMADPRVVPAGKYGKAALEQLGLWSGVADRVAPFDNVRLALTMVARGEAGLGVVYHSDAVVEPRVTEIAVFPAESHPKIVYPVAITARSTHPEAQTFWQFLQTDLARKAFEQAGFIVLEGGKP